MGNLDYDDLGSPDLQGARIRKYMTNGKHGKWNGNTLNKAFQKKTGVVYSESHFRNMLNDNRSFSKDELQIIAEILKVNFDDLYIPTIEERRTTKMRHGCIRLVDIVRNRKALKMFLNHPLDDEAFKYVVEKLINIHEFIQENSTIINKRVDYKRKRIKKQIVTLAIINDIAAEFELLPSQLLNAKRMHGNYGKYQEEFQRRFAEIWKDIPMRDTTILRYRRQQRRAEQKTNR